MTNNTSAMSSDTETNKVMLELEKKGEEQLAQVKTQNGNVGQQLSSIVSNGAKEFQEKTGRPMTYGEMRAMYG